MSNPCITCGQDIGPGESYAWTPEGKQHITCPSRGQPNPPPKVERFGLTGVGPPVQEQAPTVAHFGITGVHHTQEQPDAIVQDPPPHAITYLPPDEFSFGISGSVVPNVGSVPVMITRQPADDRLFHLGQKVKIGGDIPAFINAIAQKLSGEVSYEVVWWEGRQRRSEYVAKGEITA